MRSFGTRLAVLASLLLTLTASGCVNRPTGNAVICDLKPFPYRLTDNEELKRWGDDFMVSREVVCPK